MMLVLRFSKIPAADCNAVSTTKVKMKPLKIPMVQASNRNLYHSSVCLPRCLEPDKFCLVRRSHEASLDFDLISGERARVSLQENECVFQLTE